MNRRSAGNRMLRAVVAANKFLRRGKFEFEKRRAKLFLLFYFTTRKLLRTARQANRFTIDSCCFEFSTIVFYRVSLLAHWDLLEVDRLTNCRGNCFTQLYLSCFIVNNASVTKYKRAYKRIAFIHFYCTALQSFCNLL